MFVVILGAAGPIGRSVAAELTARGISYRVAGRDRAKLEAAFGGRAEISVADLSDPEQARRVLDGADAAVYAVGVPYGRFELHPQLMRVSAEAARQAGVTRLAVVSSVYSYGAPVTKLVGETHPREPTPARDNSGSSRRISRSMPAPSCCGYPISTVRTPRSASRT
jgi:uncharacterized protein YbjT (DUF2867 family)